MEKDFVSIVVVDWKGNDLLRDCLNSILSQTYRNFEIILIANEPRDNFLKEIRNSFPQIKIIVNEKNLFYSSSQNQGISKARGEFILSLNNDVILERNFLEEVIRAMKLDERIGIVSGKILSLDKKTIDSTGQFLSLTYKPWERGYRKPDLGQFDREGFVFGSCGACAFYRYEMLVEIKIEDDEYFDKDYGLFYEDLDLNWRANLFGWKAYYTPKAIAYHLRGASRKFPEYKFNRFEFFSLIPEYKIFLLKNRYATIIKNSSLKDFLKNFLFIFIYDFILLIYLALFNPYIFVKLFRERNFLREAYRKRKIIAQKLKRKEG